MSSSFTVSVLPAAEPERRNFVPTVVSPHELSGRSVRQSPMRQPIIYRRAGHFREPRACVSERVVTMLESVGEPRLG